MVNARNVFKLKNQSAVRSNEIDSASQFDKPSEKSNSLLKIRCGGADVKSHNETSAVFKSKKMNKFEYTKTDELKSEREHNRALAEYDKEPVRRKPTRKEGDFTAEILQRMRYCLDQDITYQNLNKTNVIETCSEQVLQR